MARYNPLCYKNPFLVILIRNQKKNTNCRIKTFTETSENKTFHSICYGSCRLTGRPVCVLLRVSVFIFTVR